jgi:hypothetical protein
MKQLRWKWLLLGLLGVLVILGICYQRTTAWVCPYCRAWKTQTACFFIPLPPRVHGSRLIRYWRRYVEPRHSHLWVPSHAEESVLLRPWSHEDSFPDMKYRIFELGQDAELAILRALPTAGQRKRFVEMTFANGPAEENSTRAAMRDFNMAYYENPRRKDWPELLKKHHLWPRQR